MRSIFAIILLLSALPLAAQTLHYQGVIENADGTPVAETSWEFEFFIYDVETGGTAVWVETQVLPVVGGHFEAQLGSVMPLDLPFDAPYWITFSFDGDPEMEPRLPLSSTPYAFRAAVADSLAGGLPSAELELPYSGNASSAIPAFRVEQTGAGKAGEFELSSESTGSAALYAQSYNEGAAVFARTQGDGIAGDFANMFPASSKHALVVGSRGSVASLYASNAGAGSAAWLDGDTRVGGELTVDGYTVLNGFTEIDGDMDLSGDLGVGSSLTTPEFRLGTAATAGQVLTTDDHGWGTWQDAPAGFSLPYSGTTSGAFPAFEVTNTHTDGSAATFNGKTYFDGKMQVNGGSSGTLVDLNSSYYYGGTTLDAYNSSNHVNGVAVKGIANAGTGGYFEGSTRGLTVKAGGSTGSVHEGIVVDADGPGYNYGLIVNAIPGSNNYQHFGIKGNIEGGIGAFSYAVSGSVDNPGVGDYAGYFHGDVEVNGTLSKSAGSFKIDHPLDPEGKYLSHSFVESPDMMNVYNGNVVLGEDGEAWVQLPEWFEALNRDFRYQLTCIGGFAPVYVAEKVSGNRFKIAGGEAGLEVSWQLTGIRQDEFARAHPIVVEEDKESYNQGRYIHPELFGAGKDRRVNQVER